MNILPLRALILSGALVLTSAVHGFAAANAELLLKPEDFHHYVDGFNKNDVERKVNYVDNASSWEWLKANIPFFDCSDRELEETYYFRWWTFRKHICSTPDGFVITEFLPNVGWAGKKYNTIDDAAPHHFYEGRWLRNRQYLKDYAYFWFRKGGEPRRYSFAAADSIRAWALVTEDQQLGIDLLPDLCDNYTAWEKGHQDTNGLFWQIDDRDGMEKSLGGSGYRPTINSYMYGDAVAIGDIAKWAGKDDVSLEFRLKADKLRELVEDKLWNSTAGFYETVRRDPQQPPANVRELVGYVPWFFNLPRPGHEVAWKQLMDPKGFYAPFGPTTAEQRDPRFQLRGPHECLWSGPSWPFATSQTLVALANVLNNYRQGYVGKGDYFQMLKAYARSQHFKLPDGQVIPFIDENLDPYTGEWIARSQLQAHNGPNKDRGRDYNHSTFNDLIISGLVGLRPRLDHSVEINPLVPEGALDYFCLDGVRYHDFDLTILYDRTGKRYSRGTGMHVFAGGQEIGSSPRLEWFEAKLPQTTAGWKKEAD